MTAKSLLHLPLLSSRNRSEGYCCQKGLVSLAIHVTIICTSSLLQHIVFGIDLIIEAEPALLTSFSFALPLLFCLEDLPEIKKKRTQKTKLQFYFQFIIYKVIFSMSKGSHLKDSILNSIYRVSHIPLRSRLIIKQLCSYATPGNTGFSKGSWRSLVRQKSESWPGKLGWQVILVSGKQARYSNGLPGVSFTVSVLQFRAMPFCWAG